MNRSKKIIAVSAAAATLGLAAVAGPGIAAEIGSQNAAPDTDEQAFQQDLADRIGVPADKVASAIDELRGERRTERMADRLDHMVEEGVLTQQQADAISAQIEAGDTEAARAAVRAAMVEKQAAALVADGTITQAQADQVIALAKDGVPIMLGGKGMGPGKGMGFGGGHHGDDDHHGGDRDHHGGDRDHYDGDDD